MTARRAIWGGTVLLLVAVAATVLVTAVPKRWPTHLARSFGHVTWYYLALVVLSGAWARLHRGTRLASLVRWRKDLGLATLLPAAAHMACLPWSTPRFRRLEFDLTGDVPGITAALILLVLAATSTDTAKRRLGPRNWKRLHRLVLLAFGLTAPAAIAAEGGWPGTVAMATAAAVLAWRVVDLRARRA